MEPPRAKVGDLVRVKQSGGRVSDVRYKVTEIGERGHCKIEEWGVVVPKGFKKLAQQDFDTSLLVVDNSGPKLLDDVLNARG